jgi:hypothetical protein
MKIIRNIRTSGRTALRSTVLTQPWLRNSSSA